jgi:NADPH-dependent 2,4-dienoyl-CoA reductase/sulfur reductase-like enzyme
MRVIIIGAVAAGMSAAAKLKRSKPEYEVVVYEKGEIVSFGACGLPYFVGGFFDEPEKMIARSPEKFIESGILIFIFTCLHVFNKCQCCGKV